MLELLENARIGRICQNCQKMLKLLENARIAGNTPTFAPKARRSVCFSSHQPSRRRREGRLLTHDHPHCLVFQIYCVYVLYMYLLDVSIRDLKYFCVLFVLFVFLFMLLALLRCYTSIFDGFIFFIGQVLDLPTTGNHTQHITCTIRLEIALS